MISASTQHTANSTLHTALHTANAALNTAGSILHTANSTLYTPGSALHTAASTLHITVSTLNTAGPALHTADSTMHTPGPTQHTPGSTLHTPGSPASKFLGDSFVPVSYLTTGVLGSQILAILPSFLNVGSRSSGLHGCCSYPLSKLPAPLLFKATTHTSWNTAGHLFCIHAHCPL